MASEHAKDLLRKYLVELVSASQTGVIQESLGSSGQTLNEMVQDAATGTAEEREVAAGASERLLAGNEVSDDESFMVEAIVLPRLRPVVDVRGNSFPTPPSPWGGLGAPEVRAKLEAAIPSIGRVELQGHPSIPYAGTGFVVGDGLLMTNRHVAELFATGVGLRDLHFRPGMGSGVDFKRERGDTASLTLRVTRVLMIHPYWDCALLRVEGLTADQVPLELVGREPSALQDREVAVIGYPARDPNTAVELQQRIFDGVFEVKRLQPGRLMGEREAPSYGRRVPALAHDSSTLGGNSGSAVVDLQTGGVIGLHFAGAYLRANYAVPSWELARDTQVTGTGVRVLDPPAVVGTAVLPWAQAWAQADGQGEAAGGLDTGQAVAAGDQAEGGDAGGSDSASPAVSPGAGASALNLLGPDWFERLDDAALSEALERDPNATRELLVQTLGEEEADELIEDLGFAGPEGLFGSKVDPSLPEIVYLHGIMGGHLANRGGAGARVWFRLRSFLRGRLAARMTLAGDGLTDEHSEMRLAADGHLRMKYSKASRRWRKQGFVVHEHSYDWRKPIALAADELHARIESLVAERPGRRLVIVAHSMGGLVSATYANRHRQWSDRIQQAILVGSPLGGSYAPAEAVLGTYPFFVTLARLARKDGIPEFMDLAVTLPGLMEMLPNPNIFDDPVDLYSSLTWNQPPSPSQRWLDQARAIKDDLLRSPLLPRTTGLVSRRHGTVDAIRLLDGQVLAPGTRDGQGDGTVPILAAAVPQLGRLLEVTTDTRHADLMCDRQVIQAVADLLRGGTTQVFASLDRATIDTRERLPLAEAPVLSEAASAGLSHRLESGILRKKDLDYLMDPLGYQPPED